MKKKILFITLIISVFLTECENKKQEESKQVVETNGMLSYTIDGEVAKEKPTKEDDYFVNKIVCDNGSDIMWDNDNWEVELTEVKSKDRCMVDFTKDSNAPGYRITVTTNSTSSLDSLSKATTENGTVIIYSKSTIKSVTGCNGTIEDNKVIVKNVTENQTCNIVIEQTLADAIKTAYPPKEGRTDFSVIDDGAPGLYIDTDDQGTTYYFSGDGTNMNNWVSFAGSLWRIIRINGNGSVRLLYAGDGNDATDIGESAFNNLYNNPMYVGWKYGTSGDLISNRANTNKSTIYGVVESWYNSSIVPSYSSYIDTSAIYCNDRSIGSGLYSTSSTFYYAARERLQTNKAPTFKCSNTSDRFNNFGLMTADEVSYAGGVYGINNPIAYYYLAKDGSGSITGDSYWWTLSPYSYSSSGGAYALNVCGSRYPGYLDWNRAYTGNVVRPVISLKAEVIVTGGDGSGDNPYTVMFS